MKTRVVVLGAGFGGLELTTILSDAFGGAIDIVLIDKDDAFVFGFSKLDVMFGRESAEGVRLPYADFAKAGMWAFTVNLGTDAVISAGASLGARR